MEVIWFLCPFLWKFLRAVKELRNPRKSHFLSSEIISKAIYFIISENYQLATTAYGFYLLSTLCSSLTHCLLLVQVSPGPCPVLTPSNLTDDLPVYKIMGKLRDLTVKPLCNLAPSPVAPATHPVLHTEQFSFATRHIPSCSSPQSLLLLPKMAFLISSAWKHPIDPSRPNSNVMATLSPPRPTYTTD